MAKEDRKRQAKIQVVKEEKMLVKELIERLKYMPQDLPVVLADWQEQSLDPSEREAEMIFVEEMIYNDKNNNKRTGKVVILGSYW